VCELDLVFNFYKVYTIVDGNVDYFDNTLFCMPLFRVIIITEMFLAGELRETSQTKVLKQLLMLNSLE
jgi:AP-2 complex subunit sigma-1